MGAGNPAYTRVLQDDWTLPRLDLWVAQLDRAIRDAATGVLIVAHSFGCLAAVRRAALDPRRIAGALLVAPANPAKFGVVADLPEERLPFPTTVVASENDPWMPFGLAKVWAERWGSEFVNLGAVGHINAESGLGAWPVGQVLLAKLAMIAKRNVLPEQKSAGTSASVAWAMATMDLKDLWM